LIDRLIRVYNLDSAAVRTALVETEAQYDAEYAEARRHREQWERENFPQYVFVETPSGVVRSSFTVAAPALKTISLPEDLAIAPESAQLEYVAELIRARFGERGGKLSLFGDIVGYRFINAYNESIRFDTGGNVIERVDGHFVGPGGAIQIGRKTVAPALLLKVLGGWRDQ
jgi:hypothetical protein